MPPRSMWKGAISFGLVTIPVAVYPATEEKSLKFNQLHDEDMGRIRYKRVCSVDGEEVEFEHIVKGYEIEKDQYVVLTDEDLDAVPVESSRAIDIQQFVDLDEIDPILFKKSYYLVPDETGAQGVRAAAQGARRGEQGRDREGELPRQGAPVPRCGSRTTSSSSRPCTGRTRSGRPSSTRSTADEKVRENEVDMAKSLIESLTEPWNPEAFKDEYREALLEIVEKKLAGEPIEAPAEAAPARVVDLMEALKASVAAAKEKTPSARTERPAAKRHGGQEDPRQAAAAKTAAKKTAPSRARAPPPGEPAGRVRRPAGGLGATSSELVEVVRTRTTVVDLGEPRHLGPRAPAEDAGAAPGSSWTATRRRRDRGRATARRVRGSRSSLTPDDLVEVVRARPSGSYAAEGSAAPSIVLDRDPRPGGRSRARRARRRSTTASPDRRRRRRARMLRRAGTSRFVRVRLAHGAVARRTSTTAGSEDPSGIRAPRRPARDGARTPMLRDDRRSRSVEHWELAAAAASRRTCGDPRGTTSELRLCSPLDGRRQLVGALMAIRPSTRLGVDRRASPSGRTWRRPRPRARRCCCALVRRLRGARHVDVGPPQRRLREPNESGAVALYERVGMHVRRDMARLREAVAPDVS